MAFFRKADAKVRTIFELPKLFGRNFQKKFFRRRLKTLSLFQHFNSSAFLSRKRVQNYCFTAYTPNIRNTFLRKICIRLHKLLIIIKQKRIPFLKAFGQKRIALPYYLYARVYREVISQPFTSFTINDRPGHHLANSKHLHSFFKKMAVLKKNNQAF